MSFTLNFEQYKYVKESKKELLFRDLTPAGVMGWLTGQKHKPISGEQISITVKFDHDCLIRNPKHQICFPVVGARGGGGGGVRPYMGYIGMCGPKGYGFSAVLVINRVSIFAP